MSQKLEKAVWFKGRKDAVLVIMDGIGFGKYAEGDEAGAEAESDLLMANCPNTKLKAHGQCRVAQRCGHGEPEVGHNAIGSGRVFDQGAKR